jgi:hypothetical protein
MRRGVLLALCALAAGACDLLPVDPAAKAAVVPVQLEVLADPTGGFAAIAARVDHAHIVISGAKGWTRDTTITVAIGEGAAHLSLVTGPDVTGPGSVRIDLLINRTVSFTGTGSLTLDGIRTSKVSVTVLPVIDGLLADTTTTQLDAIGATARLPIVFAKVPAGGPTVGVRARWTSHDPGIATAKGDTMVQSVGNGVAVLEATYLNLSTTYPVTVRQVAAGVSGIAAPSAPLRMGETAALGIIGVDRLGAALQPGAFSVGWHSTPDSILHVDPYGGAFGGCPGVGTVTYDGVANSVQVIVSNVSAPGLDFLWTRTSNGVVRGDATGRYDDLGLVGGTVPTRAPGTNRIAYIKGGRDLMISDPGQPPRALAPGLISSWPEFSADGTWIYFDAISGSIGVRPYRVRPDGTGLQALTSESVGGKMPTTSPTGDRVAFVDQNNLMMLTIGSKPVAIPGAVRPQTPKWSPDGRWIAYVASNSSGIELISPDGASRLSIPGPQVSPGLAWSPDSQRVLAAGRRATIANVASLSMAELCWITDRNGVAWWR